MVISDLHKKMSDDGIKFFPTMSREDVWNEGLKYVQDTGLILEFGVYDCTTINILARHFLDRTLHGFDSFQGLPEDWRKNYKKGTFKINQSLVRPAPNVLIHTGWFDDTLPGFTEQYQEKIALIHIDCDLYSSTREVFSHLKDRIVPGTVIIFDELWNYAGWETHEFRAFMELVAESDWNYKYLAYNDHSQVSVLITE